MAGTLGVLVLLGSQHALACVPPPPEPLLAGESSAEYSARMTRQYEAQWARARQQQVLHEQQLLASADQVVVIRVVRVAQEVDYSRHVRGGGYGFYTVGTFEVVQWVKGARGRSRFMLHSYPALTDCSSDYPISLYGLSPGDRLVMFARRGRLGMATLIDLLTQQQALDPATLALFGEARP